MSVTLGAGEDKDFRSAEFLVTGATGFIGSAVVRELLTQHAGRRVRVLTRQPIPQWMTEAGVTAVRGDLTQPSTLQGMCAGVGTVLHFASQIGGDPKTCAAVNEHGTRALLDEARRSGVTRVICLSTSAVYGMGAHRGFGESELVPAPVSVTSRTRLAAERMVLAVGGMVLRPNVVYGNGDRHVVPTLVRWLRSVPMWADGGSARMSLVAVTDLAAAAVALAGMKWDIGRVFHVNHPQPVRARELITRVCELLELPLPEGDLSVADHRTMTREAMPALTDHQHSMLVEDHWYDSSGIWDFTGLAPGPGLIARLPEAAGWYRDRLGAPVGRPRPRLQERRQRCRGSSIFPCRQRGFLRAGDTVDRVG
ncbi:nucleoside-diphosphate-sugar epimerase [Kibdelosporangium banguiense]|uniref:Nucleoside-diphosphate-sugar epimerase n=1 Tax=Kibdelosporangium banguiense TaxID=1365924 RepID=A0ABS4TT62_9PSEU|nr:NAD-dependent epimerase/dehydratase family protein [Kibdelosporangium banguiense]MBP2327143.1 nucleoside-diphosphate-sugar epimerase [Kibdelosporangium banguiense]